jgi:hypothetical protein
MMVGAGRLPISTRAVMVGTVGKAHSSLIASETASPMVVTFDTV